MSDRLVDEYDLVILDLDGVVYLGEQPVRGAVEAITQLHREGHAVAYATNNASRLSSEVAELLVGMGVPAEPGEVLTSAQASAQVLKDRFPAGAPILVVGAAALRTEIEAVGFTVVASAEESPVAVVQGYGSRVGWADLAEACVAVRAGAYWVATNTDRTLPTGRGPLPGNGALVAALATALDRQPDLVVGKPGPELFMAAARRTTSGRALVVGDRLDTDIEGGNGAGLDGLLVLTGVASPADVLAAPSNHRPAYLAADLSGLFEPVTRARVPAATAYTEPTVSGGWRVTRDGARLILDGSGETVAALRALCSPAWEAASGGAPVTEVVAASSQATVALGELGL